MWELDEDSSGGSGSEDHASILGFFYGTPAKCTCVWAVDLLGGYDWLYEFCMSGWFCMSGTSGCLLSYCSRCYHIQDIVHTYDCHGPSLWSAKQRKQYMRHTHTDEPGDGGQVIVTGTRDGSNLSR